MRGRTRAGYRWCDAWPRTRRGLQRIVVRIRVSRTTLFANMLPVIGAGRRLIQVRRTGDSGNRR